MTMNTALQLRKEILSKRDRLTLQQIASMSGRIELSLLDRSEIKTAKTIFTYVNFRSEVSTREIINQLLHQGKQVAVPITRVKEKRLDIVTISDPENDLVSGYWGIPEPREELVDQRLIAPGDIDVIILPGSVFDKRCGRFGYGGGYYDRLLSQIPAAKRIALAFDLQVVDEIPLKDHDEILDFVITEEQTISNPFRKR
jgi:5-formyltetrahydrofolate cyclo-ligase